MTNEEIAKLLDCSVRQVQRWRKEGKLEDKLNEADPYPVDKSCLPPEKGEPIQARPTVLATSEKLAEEYNRDPCANCGHITGNPGKHELKTDRLDPETGEVLDQKSIWCASCMVANNRAERTPELQAEITENSERQEKEVLLTYKKK